MTLEEIIELRQNKHTKAPCSEFWEGYREGWYLAYDDLKEILRQNEFDMNVVVIKDKE